MTNEMLYQKILRRLGVTEHELLGPSRRQGLVDARCLMAAALMRQPLMNQTTVARTLSSTQGAVSKMLTRHDALLDTDHSYRLKWQNLINNL